MALNQKFHPDRQSNQNNLRIKFSREQELKAIHHEHSQRKQTQKIYDDKTLESNHNDRYVLEEFEDDPLEFGEDLEDYDETDTSSDTKLELDCRKDPKEGDELLAQVLRQQKKLELQRNLKEKEELIAQSQKKRNEPVAAKFKDFSSVSTTGESAPSKGSRSSSTKLWEVQIPKRLDEKKVPSIPKIITNSEDCKNSKMMQDDGGDTKKSWYEMTLESEQVEATAERSINFGARPKEKYNQRFRDNVCHTSNGSKNPAPKSRNFSSSPEMKSNSPFKPETRNKFGTMPRGSQRGPDKFVRFWQQKPAKHWQVETNNNEQQQSSKSVTSRNYGHSPGHSYGLGGRERAASVPRNREPDQRNSFGGNRWKNAPMSDRKHHNNNTSVSFFASRHFSPNKHSKSGDKMSPDDNNNNNNAESEVIARKCDITNNNLEKSESVTWRSIVPKETLLKTGSRFDERLKACTVSSSTNHVSSCVNESKEVERKKNCRVPPGFDLQEVDEISRKSESSLNVAENSSTDANDLQLTSLRLEDESDGKNVVGTCSTPAPQVQTQSSSIASPPLKVNNFLWNESDVGDGNFAIETHDKGGENVCVNVGVENPYLPAGRVEEFGVKESTQVPKMPLPPNYMVNNEAMMMRGVFNQPFAVHMQTYDPNIFPMPGVGDISMMQNGLTVTSNNASVQQAMIGNGFPAVVPPYRMCNNNFGMYSGVPVYPQYFSPMPPPFPSIPVGIVQPLPYQYYDNVSVPPGYTMPSYWVPNFPFQVAHEDLQTTNECKTAESSESLVEDFVDRTVPSHPDVPAQTFTPQAATKPAVHFGRRLPVLNSSAGNDGNENNCVPEVEIKPQHLVENRRPIKNKPRWQRGRGRGCMSLRNNANLASNGSNDLRPKVTISLSDRSASCTSLTQSSFTSESNK